ncbi:hypothetical protein JIN85_16325 [Luteolibacter pohnpeiensis]|uniref:PEP-CTERM protein-sorting domain-containing protein n=1 Tax=Luteolibacter pohnpeiensis TaxID=454153 RepID=A0A934VVW0_9BACT|nr:hypothetical protein [Luteolibacter pohnpeiensis]MBK1883987.1 hypothetical protein [Luteolibacter pohnpeiensis]
MKKYLFSAMLCLGSAKAATVSYSDSFNVNESYASITSPQEVFSAGYLTAQLPAFDASLGTLESFTITWSLSGTLDASSGGGSVGYVGDFLIASTTLTGASGGGGGGGGGAPVSFSFPGGSTSFSYTYNVADVGTTFDQTILDALTGGGDVDVTWDTPFTISSTFTDANISINASVDLTYTYSPIPEPSSALLGAAAIGSAFVRRRR